MDRQSLRLLIALEKLDPYPVRVFDEGLVPAPDFVGSDENLHPFCLKFADRRLQILNLEPQVIDFRPIRVGLAVCAPMGIPVELNHLFRARAPQGGKFTMGLGRFLAFDEMHA